MTFRLDDEMVLRTDFNNVAGRGRVKASLRYASSDRRPDIGEVVLLQDEEGNACHARVDEVRGNIVVLEPDWDRWSSDADAHAIQHAVLA